ncbi:MAG: hypothetical protein R3C53_14935 [Pirellulaceae bacterium]
MTIAERQAMVAARTPEEFAARLERANDVRRVRDGIPSRLYHYTDEAGEAGIRASQELRPSLKAVNPKSVSSKSVLISNQENRYDSVAKNFFTWKTEPQRWKWNIPRI